MAAFELNVAGRGAGGGQVGAMGKPTGFLELKRELPPDRSPLERIQRLGRVPRAVPGQEAARPGRALHGLRHALLPHRRADRRHGHRLPHQQPDPRVERPRLPRPLEGGARPPAQDQQLPRVHRPRLPRAVRGLVRARHHRPAGHDQDHRGRDHRQGLRRGLGRARAARSSAPARRSPSSAPGPAGLAAAAQLNRAGHTVTVFERADRIGGLLMYGIPNMKLDKSVVERRVSLMAAEGHQVRRRRRASARTIPADKLLAEFDAIVLCGGATLPRDLPIEGRELAGHPLRDGVPAQRTRKSLLDSNLQDGQLHLRQGQGRGRHRRRRHRHRLRRHVDAPRLPQPGAARDPAQAAAGARAATIPGRSGRRSTSSTTARKRRRRSFGADPRDYCVTTKRFVGDDERPREGDRHRRASSGCSENGRFIHEGGPRHGADLARDSSCCWRMGFLGPENGGMLDQLGVDARRARQRGQAEHGDSA